MYLKDSMGLIDLEEDSDELYEIEYVEGKYRKVGYPADELEEEDYEYNEDKCSYQKIKRVWDW